MATLTPHSSIQMASVQSSDAAPLPDVQKNKRAQSRAQLAGTIITVVSVSVLAFAAMSLVIGAAIGVALTRMGLSEAVIWPIIAVPGMIALFVSYKLGVKVWNYETGSEAGNR
jgi:sterol desaturase/sphingolipid hydroxylase (fatty acid hydroxylase superfamily)